MAINLLPLPVLLVAWDYLIAALGGLSEITPLYEMTSELDPRDLVVTLLRAGAWIIGLSVLAYLAIEVVLGLGEDIAGDAAMLIAALSALRGARRIRSRVKATANGPMNWLLSPRCPRVNLFLLRHPMLLFDAWTIGVAVLSGLLFVLASLRSTP